MQNEHDRTSASAATRADDKSIVAAEAACARARVRSAAQDLRRSMGRAANPMLWLKRYPAACGVIAVAVGLSIGAAIYRGSRPGKNSRRHGRNRRRQAEQPSWVSILADTSLGLISTMRSAVISALTSRLIWGATNEPPNGPVDRASDPPGQYQDN